MPSMSERAEAAIGEENNTSDWQLRPEEHALALPTEAGALQRILQRPELKQLVAQFREADAAALSAQARYKRIGRTSLYAALLRPSLDRYFYCHSIPGPLGHGVRLPSYK